MTPPDKAKLLRLCDELIKRRHDRRTCEPDNDNAEYSVATALKSLLTAPQGEYRMVPVEQAFEETIVKPLRGRYDEKHRISDFAMFSLGYKAAAPQQPSAQPSPRRGADTLICACGTEKECLGGRSAHISNWYCPKCDVEHSPSVAAPKPSAQPTSAQHAAVESGEDDDCEDQAFSPMPTMCTGYHRIHDPAPVVMGDDGIMRCTFCSACYGRAAPPSPSVAAPQVSAQPAALEGVEQWRHIANEYADAACNAIQWLRNVRDGISPVADAIADMEDNLKRIRAVQPSPSVEAGGTPSDVLVSLRMVLVLLSQKHVPDEDRQIAYAQVQRAITALQSNPNAELVEALQAKAINPSELSPEELFNRNGLYVSLDLVTAAMNTRRPLTHSVAVRIGHITASALTTQPEAAVQGGAVGIPITPKEVLEQVRDGTLLAPQQPAGNWISVKERLPTIKLKVLVAYVDKSVGTKRGDDVTVNDGWITHWMPLPAPPHQPTPAEPAGGGRVSKLDYCAIEAEARERAWAEVEKLYPPSMDKQRKEEFERLFLKFYRRMTCPHEP